MKKNNLTGVTGILLLIQGLLFSVSLLQRFFHPPAAQESTLFSLLALTPSTVRYRSWWWQIATHSLVYPNLLTFLAGMGLIGFLGRRMESSWGGKEEVKLYVMSNTLPVVFAFLFFPTATLSGPWGFVLALGALAAWEEQRRLGSLKIPLMVVGALLLLTLVLIFSRGEAWFFTYYSGLAYGGFYACQSAARPGRFFRMKFFAGRRKAERFLKTQRRVETLLGKISTQGYNSLTDEEKAFLKKASQTYQKLRADQDLPPLEGELFEAYQERTQRRNFQ